MVTARVSLAAAAIALARTLAMKPVLVVSMATMVMATVLATEIASKQSIDEATTALRMTLRIEPSVTRVASALSPPPLLPLSPPPPPP